MTLACLMMSSGYASAQSVCVETSVIKQCKRDALEVDGARARVRACQRDLDAERGSLNQAMREGRACRGELAQANADLARAVFELDKTKRERDKARSRGWVLLGMGALTGAGTVLVFWLAAAQSR